MGSSEIKAKLQEAISLAQAGQLAEARSLLNEIVKADPKQELAWMWLATVSTNRQERIQYLERALALNPKNPTSQQAYSRLTGLAFTPSASSTPPGEAASKRPAWRKLLTQDAPVSLPSVFMLMAVAAAAVIIIVVAVNSRRNNASSKKPRPLPTLQFLVPTATPTSRYSPTPSRTPFPTPTEGPSPTRIWDAGVATWTPVPTLTQPPSLTPLPSWTPLPTQTDTLTPLPPTETFTPPPTITPRTPSLSTATPSAIPTNPATQTAEAALTSDQAASMTPSPGS